MAKTNTITARIDPELDAALARIAETQGRSKSAIITEALQSYASYDAWIRAQVQIGLDQADAGELIPHEEVMAEMDAIIERAIKKRGAA
ncbi:MAG: ribbon-helix-helix protein, CopG family [Ferrovibrio sp.]|nr:ribbon-helix-helix protein, CopG family [Ferrovibrio sp.]